MNLYPYQKHTVVALRNSILSGHTRICLASPTGSGKTVMFSFLGVEHLKKNGKVLIITHRIELLKQSRKEFPTIQEIKAGNEPDLTGNIHIAMIETLNNRALDIEYIHFLRSRTLVIIDECHIQNFNKIYKYFPQTCIILGVTATPLRIGKQEALDKVYTDLVQIIDTPELVDLKFLSKAKTFGIPVNLKGIDITKGDYDAQQVAQRYS